MGKPTGFLEYGREPEHSRAPLERLADWREFHPSTPLPILQQQGARCMDCGVPFCHTGRILNGMASGCPINNLIPEWNDLAYRGRWREALERLEATNPFPEFTGRVCPAPCEGSCVLGINEDPVTIKNIERAIVDKAFEEGWIIARPPTARSGRSVAIVGSGPAGLACAQRLNRAGHAVTVYERSDRPGGLLTYGIPNMKLDKSLVERRLDLLRSEGVRFVTGANIGSDIDPVELRRAHDALVLAVGAGKPRDLAVAGRSLQGIHYALEFLASNTKHVLDQREGPPPIDARDRNVVVIGGGDTGTDCVATALRHGCRSLVQFEILPQPPAARAPDNPWPQWPKIHRTDYGHEEARARFGRDPREFAIVTKELLGDATGRVRGIRTSRVEWQRAPDGRPRMQEQPGSDRLWDADLVLLALGFVGPETNGSLDRLGVQLDERGNIRAGPDKQTSVPGVFAAGDAARGPSLVVWAIQEGLAAADGVDRYLDAVAKRPSGTAAHQQESRGRDTGGR